jgi:hypothetical protein
MMKAFFFVRDRIRVAMLIASVIGLLANPLPTFSQGIHENLSDQFLKTVAYVIGSTRISSTNVLLTQGTGTLYAIPVASGKPLDVPRSLVFSLGPNSHPLFDADPFPTNAAVFCLVTAKHNLYVDPETMLHPHANLIFRFNRLPSSRKAVYVRIPLISTQPRNYWLSDRGLDLAVIPLPAYLLNGADSVESDPDNILTAANYHRLEILPGSAVVASVIQYEYLDQNDYQTPEVIPLLRCGHLSRLGIYTLDDTNTFVRLHVIDLYASPGNSGSPVSVFTKSGYPIFLGLIEGFIGDSSTRTIEAPVETKIAMALSTGTNQFVHVPIPNVNPNLTFVTPVDELVTITNSPSLPAIFSTIESNRASYTFTDQF